ncbi:MAG: ABC transporter permease subunit [Gammaproteobacteria bacterium]
MNQTAPAPSTLSMLTASQSARLRRRRQLKEWLARGGIMLGGVGVIAAVALIFFYLLWEVAPLFGEPKVEPQTAYTLPAAAAGTALFTAIEEQNEVGFRLLADGSALFFDAATGAAVDRQRIAHADVAALTRVAPSSAAAELLAAGFADGRVVVLHEQYQARYDADGTRSIETAISYPFGEAPIALLDGPVSRLAVSDEGGLRLAALGADGQLAFARYSTSENLMTGEVTFSEDERQGTTLPGDVLDIWFNNDGRFLFVVYADGRVSALDTRDLALRPEPVTLGDGVRATSSAMLLGQISLLVGDDRGHISQLFLVRDAQNNYHLAKVRRLSLGDRPIRHLQPEQRRKAFVAVDETGRAGLFSTTSQRLALAFSAAPEQPVQVAVAPRGDGMLVIGNNGVTPFHIDNEHPDVSWAALWQKIWYENYDEEKFIWQSSAANNDFEPKYSLVPLVFGTLKAAFFAMLMAIPLAICGAIYTAHFMAPALRKAVKPTIELMEALPTVILGFLAGLWLAPMVEGSLPGILAMLLLTPVMVIIAAWAWFQLPERTRHTVPAGFEPLLLVPVIVIAIAVPLAASDWMETVFFGGDMRLWLHDSMGIPFDQRNALIIGFAMGFAVIPTIYSIAEDALFEVPKHLTQGSLALGATPWQTVMRVVLPTASPGIFSAVMMGFGRAVGETMIVLMATGNTPVMTMNIFEGLRTLSANIAVEMPESEVGSSHFRILFLAALVLFLFTFIVNTSAELVRQRLRKKYGTL